MMAKGDTRCDGEGRILRHDPFPDDPYLETDIGECPGCGMCCGDPDDEDEDE